jgi:hypothetical protein
VNKSEPSRSARGCILKQNCAQQVKITDVRTFGSTILSVEACYVQLLLFFSKLLFLEALVFFAML